MYDEYMREQIRNRLRNVNHTVPEMRKIEKELGVSINTQRNILKEKIQK